MPIRHATFAAALIALAFSAGGAAAQGHEGHHGHGATAPRQTSPAAKSTTSIRSVAVEAGDAGFDKQVINVRAGETVRFVLRNSSRFFLHEFTIGPASAQREHQLHMLKMLQTGILQSGSVALAHHTADNSVLLAPGESKEIVWRFKSDDTVEFGCSIPGHYAAGMKGEFAIERAATKRRQP